MFRAIPSRDATVWDASECTSATPLKGLVKLIAPTRPSLARPGPLALKSSARFLGKVPQVVAGELDGRLGVDVCGCVGSVAVGAGRQIFSKKQQIYFAHKLCLKCQCEPEKLSSPAVCLPVPCWGSFSLPFRLSLSLSFCSHARTQLSSGTTVAFYPHE